MRTHKSLDKMVRRITSGILVTLLVFLGVVVCSSPLPSGSFTVSADTYEEPVIRIGLVLREKRATSYKISAAKGFRFGYMDQSNDRFVSFDITDETAVKAELDDFYYIDDETVSAGDVVVKNNSSGTYTIGSDVDKLTGVYNINKGYAVFKQIDILTQNNKYTIVDTGTSYGVALYDHIALDGSKIKENQLVVK